jgi:hypothetical protein
MEGQIGTNKREFFLQLGSQGTEAVAGFTISMEGKHPSRTLAHHLVIELVMPEGNYHLFKPDFSFRN